MSEFKVGDRVRVNATIPPYRGGVGTVVKVGHRGFPIEVGGFDHDPDLNTCAFRASELELVEPSPDPINHPDHYKWLPVEAIEITEHFNFTMGNALKYILRADHKGRPIEDLKKAIWYLEREVARRESAE